MTIAARYFPRVLLAGFIIFGAIAGSSAQETLPTARPGIAPVLEKVTPAVVNIAVTGHTAPQQNPLLNDPSLRRFFDIPDQPSRPTQGAGSGVIIDAEQGYVLTNHHVVNNADAIEVTLSDKRTYPATLIGSDAGTDIALLQIEAENLSEVPLSDSETLRVGDYVAAIGNPFGIGQTVTTGIVSALSRQTGINADGYEDFIQTDASINPGNSGGALIDFQGHLVGINSAIIAPSGGNVGIGFAVPINMAMAVVDQLLEFGEIRRGMLGVRITDLTPDVVEALNLKVRTGAVVSSVEPGSPAEAAGIQAGDIIVAVGDEIIEGASDLRNTIGLTRAGSEVAIALIRDNTRVDYDVRIGNASDVADSGMKARSSSVLEGAELSEIPANHEAFGKVSGVLVTNVVQGSRAFRSGLEIGDIITAVNRAPVTSRSELAAVLDANAGTVAMNVLRGNQQLFLIMR